jgi:hypothetical protein
MINEKFLEKLYNLGFDFDDEYIYVDGYSISYDDNSRKSIICNNIEEILTKLETENSEAKRTVEDFFKKYKK